MKKYLVEFAMAENFTAVDEWQTMDGMEVVEAENGEDAAKWGGVYRWVRNRPVPGL